MCTGGSVYGELEGGSVYWGECVRGGVCVLRGVY